MIPSAMPLPLTREVIRRQRPRAPSGGSKRGTLGAVFRALTRGATSTPTIKQGQELLRGRHAAPCPVPVRLPRRRRRRIRIPSLTTAPPTAHRPPRATRPIPSGTPRFAPAPADGNPEDPFGDATATPRRRRHPETPSGIHGEPAPTAADDPFAEGVAPPAEGAPAPADEGDPFADDELP